ncbi:MAG: hypothetical protein HY854_26035 [Burkholderiales bacterium]|nr:hypothetical protein [Burkholderiales bacterium]
MRRLSLLAATLALLAGCVSTMNAWNAEPGMTREQVVARAGPPLRTVPLAGGGQRMQYTMMPMGHYAFMVDLDASGRVVRSRQVMTPQEFERIEPGKWTRADVEREFGPPADIGGVASFQGSVMTYRWMEANNNRMFYWVYVDPQGVVQRAHPGMEFINAPNDRN